MAANATRVPGTPRTYEAQDSITRPADTNQYAAGDVISDHTTTPTAGGYFTLSFPGYAAGYGSVMLTDFPLHKSDHDVTNASFAVLLFTTLPTLLNLDDNGQCAITDAEMLECKGAVSFGASGWINAALGDVQTVSQNMGVVMGEDSTVIYGVLLAADTYTPANAEKFTLTVHGIQD